MSYGTLLKPTSSHIVVVHVYLFTTLLTQCDSNLASNCYPELTPQIHYVTAVASMTSRRLPVLFHLVQNSTPLSWDRMSNSIWHHEARSIVMTHRPATGDRMPIWLYRSPLRHFRGVVFLPSCLFYCPLLLFCSFFFLFLRSACCLNVEWLLSSVRFALSKFWDISVAFL